MAVADVIRGLVVDNLLVGVHDCADGGVGLALAEMAVHSGVGFRVGGIADHGALFGEAPSRAVLCVAEDAWPEVTARAGAAGVALHELGVADGDRVVFDGLLDLALADAVAAWRDRLPMAFGAGTAQSRAE